MQDPHQFSDRHRGVATTETALRRILFWGPVPVLLAWCLLVFNETTYPIVSRGFRQAREYTVIEMVTAFGFVFAFALGLWLAYRHVRASGLGLVAVYWALFAFVAALAALEETQWGQPLLGYEIPDWMLEVNRQGEFTLHNVEGLQGRAEWFYIVFVVAAGVLTLPRMPILPDRIWTAIRADPSLVPLLLCVLVTTLMKVFQGAFDPDSVAFDAIRWTTEWTEGFIAIWGVGYAALHVLTRPRQDDRSQIGPD
ncbi:hypothetical protein ACK8OR_07630 [Jannaschia sp. KMU-145]|uniref:hypothetical protein n=1 Tax=Jannaschia halovivens TaxID=3388667 RepID=UPI00396B2139